MGEKCSTFSSLNQLCLKGIRISDITDELSLENAMCLFPGSGRAILNVHAAKDSAKLVFTPRGTFFCVARIEHGTVHLDIQYTAVSCIFACRSATTFLQIAFGIFSLTLVVLENNATNFINYSTNLVIANLNISIF